MKRKILLFGATFLVAFGVTAASAQTLKKVKDRGSLICGVSQGLPGFSNPDDKGNWTGFDVDFCRAIAAAVLNDAAKVKFTPLSAKDRFEPLKTGDIDLLSRNTTWTLSRDVAFGNFAGVTYYDGQGFMVRKALKVNSALELNGASVCTQTGTTTELNLADYFRANNMKYEVIAFGTGDETVKAYEVRSLRRVHDRRLAALLGEAQARRTQTIMSSCPRSSRRSRLDRWCGTATINGSTSSSGPTTSCSMPRNSASPPRMSMRR